MKKFFTFIAFACLTALSAMAAKVTTITDIAKAIEDGTVVNLCIGDQYLYGPNDQNTAMGDANAAKASSNGCVGYKIEKDGDNYMFRCVTPQGGDYKIWGRTEPNYLNAQPNIGGVTFNLNNGTQKGTDMANGAVWSIEADGSLKNVGNGGYFAGTKTSAEPVAVTFVTIEADPEPEPEKITVPESLKPFIENKTIFTLKNGDNYVYGPDQQNLAIGSWEQASAESNNANGYILEVDEYYFYLRAVKADGSDISAWGTKPCWLNNNGGNIVFNMGKDQDVKNGSSWTLAEVGEGKYSIESVNQPGKYLAIGANGTSGTLSTDVTEWELYVPQTVAKFDITANEDNTVKVTPDPETASYVVAAYNQAEKEKLFAMVGCSTDKELVETMMGYHMLSTMTGVQDVNVAEFIDQFGMKLVTGAYNIVVAEVKDGAIVGDVTAKEVVLEVASVTWPLGAPESVVVTPETITLVWDTTPVSDKENLTLEGSINLKDANGTVYFGGFSETAAEAGKFTCTANLVTFASDSGAAPEFKAGDEIQVIYSDLTLYAGSEELFDDDPELDNTTVTVTAAPEPLQEIVLDVVDADVSDSEVWNIYENEDYKVYFDITKNLPLDPTRTYTLEDMDAKYSYIYSKNDIVTNDYGTKNWQKYEYTSASVKIGANNELEAIVEAKNGEDVIKAKFVFNNPNPITVTLDGETEYIADMNAYAVSAANKGSELKADYSVQLGIKGDAYESKTTFTEDDLMANGNSIRVATKETKIVSANITLTVGAESQTYEGTVVGADEKTYAINITTNIPSKEAKKETVDFGSVLLVSEDEGDIKFVAENEDARFVGYISCATTDVPAGEYALLSYSKFGEYNSTAQQYMMTEMADAKVVVTNTDGVVAITATFTQESKEYTVTASIMPIAVSGMSLTAEENQGLDEEGYYTVVFNHTFTVKDPSKIDPAGYTYVTANWEVYDENNKKVVSSMDDVKYTKSSTNIYIEGLEAGKTYTIKMVELSGACMNMSTFKETSLINLTSGLPSLTFTVAAPKPENTDLTKDMFFTWTSAGADAEHAADQSKTWCDYVLNESTGMPYGNGNVDWMQYADISAYEKLVVTATAGSPRFFLNRKTADGQAPDNAIDTAKECHYSYVEKVDNGDGSFNYILDIAKIVSDYGFAHLNVIKEFNWGAKVTVTKMLLVNGEVPTGINNATINNAMKVGKFVENGKVVIVKNGKKYSVNGAQIK